jgi:hypothetical protein
VARNDEGAVLAGLSAPVPFVVDATTAEVMAAWRAVKLGMRWATNRSFWRETPCLLLML